MAVRIVHASIDERGRISGGNIGDQTSKEVCIRNWYKKPWDYCIRFKDANLASKAVNNAINTISLIFTLFLRKKILLTLYSIFLRLST